MSKVKNSSPRQVAALWRLIIRLETMLRFKGVSRSELDEVRLKVFEHGKRENNPRRSFPKRSVATVIKRRTGRYPSF